MSWRNESRSRCQANCEWSHINFYFNTRFLSLSHSLYSLFSQSPLSLSLSLSGNSFLLSAFVAAFEIFHCILLCGCIFVALRQFVVQFISESSSARGEWGEKGEEEEQGKGREQSEKERKQVEAVKFVIYFVNG